MQKYKEEFIKFMIESGVLTFGDFVTKSGRKTPFFINAGNFKTGRQLKKLGEYYARVIHDNFGKDFNVLFGPSYKGIPISAASAIALYDMYGTDVSYCSNRKEVKDHGDKGILLGKSLKDGDRVIIVEDVTTAGTSIYETMPIIKAQGNIDVSGLVISVDRMEKGKNEISALNEIGGKFNLKTCSIVTMKEVVEYLYDKEIDGKIIIDDNIKEKIDEYYKMYGAAL